MAPPISLIPPDMDQAPQGTRFVVAILTLVLAGLFLWAGAHKVRIATEGSTKPPASWNWQPGWDWPPSDWNGLPTQQWYRDGDRIIDRMSGVDITVPPYTRDATGRVIDRETGQALEQVGIDRVEMINVISHALRPYIPISPMALLILVLVAELAVGLGLLVGGRFRTPVAAAGAILLAMFSVAMILARPELAGRDCGCFGGLLDFDSLGLNLLRNAAMIAGLLFVGWAWRGEWHRTGLRRR